MAIGDGRSSGRIISFKPRGPGSSGILRALAFTFTCCETLFFHQGNSRPAVCARLALVEPAARSIILLRKLELENAYAEYRLRSVEEARHRAYPGELLFQKISGPKGEICSQTPEADGWLPVRVEELALQNSTLKLSGNSPCYRLRSSPNARRSSPDCSRSRYAPMQRAIVRAASTIAASAKRSSRTFSSDTRPISPRPKLVQRGS